MYICVCVHEGASIGVCMYVHVYNAMYYEMIIGDYREYRGFLPVTDYRYVL